MGYLLKEALKTLCGVNQWSYAVFWKIGCQNPKLLIWEECYYESASCSGLPELSGNEHPEAAFHDYNASWVSAETRSNVQAGNKVHLLVNKMMMDNQVNIVGEGLVGRVAFTGNHQWILSENYFREAHPPEVLKEMCQQFPAGIQTVAVIPVLPHGVVQFGSFLTIRENMGFVNDVISLVLQLGYVSGVLLSGNDAADERAPRIGGRVCLGNSTPSSLQSNVVNAPCLFDDFNFVGNSGQTTMVDTQTSFPVAREIRNQFQAPNSTPSRSRLQYYHEDYSSSSSLMNGVAKAEVIPSNSELWMNQHASLYIPRSSVDVPSGSSSSPNPGRDQCTEQKNLCGNGNQGRFSTPNVSTAVVMPTVRTNSDLIYCSDDASITRASIETNEPCKGSPSNVKRVSGIDSLSDVKWAADGNFTSKNPISSELKNVNFPKMEVYNSLLAYSSGSKNQEIPVSQYSGHLNMAEMIPGFVEDERKQNDTKYEDAYVQPESRDDLFDALGADFKSKLFNSCWNSNLSCDKNNLPSKSSLASSDIYSMNSESGIFSSTGTDHLLEAVVSKVNLSVKNIIDDDVSCRTTLTNMSSSSAPNTSLPYGRLGVSDHVKGELFGVPKYLAKAGTMCSSKEESGTYSQGSSIYGSQISSWIEKDQKGKQNNSVSTGYSKKPDETSKTNRKRLKPGENPRPRPKDRQLIQDRVKELREIVPNGAKCSIDALLERTIKHMLFLQSVTKHADKLKQTGESKIISKDGGLLLKDNFEGGATWAYEVGSQSMVCPIIVEDLNQPRQMLVEMLCEERGLFLEIADIIRGLGLTILKGVMESRNDKIWARFAVEANRDVTRMEIFISLVRLLEQSANSGVAQPNGGVSSESLMAQQFHQLGSAPMTGRSRSVQ